VLFLENGWDGLEILGWGLEVLDGLGVGFYGFGLGGEFVTV